MKTNKELRDIIDKLGTKLDNVGGEEINYSTIRDEDDELINAYILSEWGYSELQSVIDELSRLVGEIEI